MKGVKEALFPEKLKKSPFFGRCMIAFVLFYGIGAELHSETVLLYAAILIYFYMVFFILLPRHRVTNLPNAYKLGIFIPILYAILLLTERDKGSWVREGEQYETD